MISCGRFPEQPTSDRVDCVLLGGDANWHAVTDALESLRARQGPEHFPLVMVTEIAWPHGRRDSYLDPGGIPDEALHPHRRLGVRPRRSALAGDGVFADRNNCVFEFGTRNGVLTAVEDFVGGQQGRIQLVVVDGFAGLGLLAGSRALGRSPLLRGMVEDRDAALGSLGLHAALAEAQVAREKDALLHAQRRARDRRLGALPRRSYAWPAHPGTNAFRTSLRAALTAHPLLAQLLRLADEILVRERIPYSIDGGVLLGLLRHGGLIPHDDDLDIVVNAEDLARTLQAFDAAGFPSGSEISWSHGGLRLGWIAYPTDDPVAHGWSSPAIDVFPAFEGKADVVRPADMGDLARHAFLDFTVSAPRDPRPPIHRYFGASALTECRVWGHALLHEQPCEPMVLSLEAYERVCSEEGYRAPTTV